MNKQDRRTDRKKHNGNAHSKEFKLSAVKLVTEQGYGAKEAALSLGIAQSTLQYWIRTCSVKPREEAQTDETLRLRVRELEGQNRRLLMEREILKKALGFFASVKA
jgi:transposase